MRDGRKNPKIGILAEYDLTGTIIWISPYLADHLGTDALMAAGENLRIFLPSRIHESFNEHLKKYSNSFDFSSDIKYDLPSLISPVAIQCYHLPVFGDNKMIISIKIVGYFLF